MIAAASMCGIFDMIALDGWMDSFYEEGAGAAEMLATCASGMALADHLIGAIMDEGAAYHYDATANISVANVESMMQSGMTRTPAASATSLATVSSTSSTYDGDYMRSADMGMSSERPDEAEQFLDLRELLSKARGYMRAVGDVPAILYMVEVDAVVEADIATFDKEAYERELNEATGTSWTVTDVQPASIKVTAMASTASPAMASTLAAMTMTAVMSLPTFNVTSVDEPRMSTVVNVSPPPPPVAAQGTGSGEGGGGGGGGDPPVAAIGGAIGGVVVAIVIGVVAWCYCRKKTSEKELSYV